MNIGNSYHVCNCLKISNKKQNSNPGLATDLFNEQWSFIDDEGNFKHIVGLQHIIIHTLFVIHGVSDLMEYYKLPVVKGMKYFTAAVAFFWYVCSFFSGLYI